MATVLRSSKPTMDFMVIYSSVSQGWLQDLVSLLPMAVNAKLDGIWLERFEAYWLGIRAICRNLCGKTCSKLTSNWKLPCASTCLTLVTRLGQVVEKGATTDWNRDWAMSRTVPYREGVGTRPVAFDQPLQSEVTRSYRLLLAKPLPPWTFAIWSSHGRVMCKSHIALDNWLCS